MEVIHDKIFDYITIDKLNEILLVDNSYVYNAITKIKQVMQDTQTDCIKIVDIFDNTHQEYNILNSKDVWFFLLNYYPIHADTKNKIYERLDITGSTNLYNSYNIHNSTGVANSSQIHNSSIIDNSMGVAFSNDVADSYDISHSHNIYDSADVVNSYNIISGREITNVHEGYGITRIQDSVFVNNSTQVNNSKYISFCTNIDYCERLAFCINCEHCYISTGLNNCKRCLFCNDLSDCEYYVFNKPVTIAEYLRIYNLIIDCLALEIEGQLQFKAMTISNYKAIKKSNSPLFVTQYLSEQFWEVAREVPGFSADIIQKISGYVKN